MIIKAEMRMLHFFLKEEKNFQTLFIQMKESEIYPPVISIERYLL